MDRARVCWAAVTWSHGGWAGPAGLLLPGPLSASVPAPTRPGRAVASVYLNHLFTKDAVSCYGAFRGAKPARDRRHRRWTTWKLPPEARAKPTHGTVTERSPQATEAEAAVAVQGPRRRASTDARRSVPPRGA